MASKYLFLPARSSSQVDGDEELPDKTAQLDADSLPRSGQALYNLHGGEFQQLTGIEEKLA
jgi:hypothetical protein